ncbi:MAG: M20/M25/M40 family metallo-hydrolase [Armatimonadetes bacterium]|nr:M20/M25/M40 family metallo-hydrolase [Armatimonadota bacterium]
MDDLLARVERHVRAHLDEDIGRIQTLIRQPSISSENRGIRETATMLYNDFQALGCREARIFETPGHPIVYGHLDAGAPKTLIAYFMYDTEAILEDQPWIAPPLAGNLVDFPPFGRCIVGRGAINTKGPMGAFLNAARAIQAVGGPLPVNLKFVAEGEEELGSWNLGEFIRKNATMLAADALLFPMPRQEADGRVTVALGSRRGVIFELECNGELWGRGPAKFGIHSGNRSLVDSPVSRLIEAVASMATDNGNRVLIDGFYDGALPPDAEQNELLDRLATQWNEEAFRGKLGVHGLIDGLHGRAALQRLMFTPELNIRGFHGGDVRPGDVTVSMAVLPHRAVAKMSVSLVPNMNKEDVANKIRAHLDRHGYRDVKMTLRPGTTTEPGSWGRVSVKDDIVAALLATYERFGVAPEIWPISPGGWPGHLFQKYLGTSLVAGGVGHGGRAHSPNEYLVVDGNDRVKGLVDCEVGFAATMQAFARR